MSARLHAYQRLERVVLDLDEAGDPLADHLRDLMDPLWYALTDEEHALLDARPVSPSSVQVAARRPAIPTETRILPPAGTLIPLGRAA
jgi:hypothetical protein